MLQKQTITIPLGLGVNTKTDEKLVEQGMFNLVCENAVFEKVGAVKKRDAYKSLPTSYYNNASAAGTVAGDYSALTNYPTCAAAIGKSLFLRNQIGEYWYQYDNAFVYNNSRPIPEFKITSVAAYASPTTIDHTDTNYDPYENIVLAVGREGNQNGSLAGQSANASTLVIYDMATEAKVITTSIPSGGSSSSFGFVRCAFTRVSGVSYYYNIAIDTTGKLQVKIFNKFGQESSVSFSISGIQTAGPVTVGGLAVCRSSDSQTIYIICSTSTTNTGKIVAISGTTKTVETTFSTNSSYMPAISAKYDSGLIHVIYPNRKIILNPNGTVNTADTAISGASFNNSVVFDQDSVNILFGDTNSSYASLVSGVQSVENSNTLLMSDKITLNGVPFVIGKSFEGSNFSNEATYFALGYAAGSGRSGQKAFARFCAGNALSPNRNTYYQAEPARFAKISSTKAVIALPQFSNETGLGLTYQMQLFFIEVNQDYTSNNRAILGRNLHFQGGFVAEFDGVNLIENGFLLGPGLPTLDVAASGSLTGTYTYKVVYRYTDKNGQITRSAPSPQVSTGSITSKKAALSINTSPFGIKAKNCVVEIYRTKNNGSSFFYVAEAPVDMYSAASVLLYTDESTDATIGANTILYTEGNVLQNDPAPACKGICQGGNRLFAWGLEDENEVAYSKKKLFGESVNFSDFFRIRFDSAQFSISGGVVACGYMDDKFIAFKKNSIFFVSGDGPNETGSGSTFTEPELITSDTGCTDPRSVVLTPMGLMFKGQKGIYLLDRGLNTKYIGSEVEAFNSYNIVSACYIDKKNHVIFSLISSDSTQKYQLVYDYFTQQWSISKGIRALDADVLSGFHVVLDSILKAPLSQNGTDYLDNSSAYSVRVVTPWIKVSGVQDFARIWTASIIGKYKAPHTLRVTVYYDYASDYSEVFDIIPSSSDSQYQYRIHLKKQKCESIQFEIQDLSQTGESMELTALTLEVGLRRGSMKLAASRKY